MSIPEEIKDALSALSHSVRWQIIELIREDESLSYTELLLRLDIRKGSLTHHLNRLMETGILDNYSGEEFSGPYTSYYQLSPFGEDLITGILSSIEIPPFLEQKEKSYEPRTSEFRESEMQKQSEQVSVGNMMYFMKADFKEPKEAPYLNIVSDKNATYNIRRRYRLWSRRELDLILRGVKTNE